MKHVRLVAAPDAYGKDLGLTFVNGPKFEDFMTDRDGTLLAHDIVEHQNGRANMGPVWDELEALGAIWYVRGRWGDMMTYGPSYHSPEVNVASDVTRMFRQWLREDDMYCGPNGYRVGMKESDYDDDFNSIIEIAWVDIRKELDDDCDESCDDIDKAIQLYMALALRRMRSGFRKAQKRWERGGASRFYAGNMFCAIRDAINSALKDVDFEGQEFRLSYGNGEAHCVPVYDEDYY